MFGHLGEHVPPHRVDVRVLGEVGVEGAQLLLRQARDVHDRVPARGGGGVQQQVPDLERLEPLRRELRVRVRVLGRRVRGAHHGLAAGEVVRVGGLHPLPVPLRVGAEHHVRADAAHQRHELAAHAVVRLEVSVALAEEVDLGGTDDGGGRALFGVPAGGHRLRALRVEAAGVPVRHDAQLDVQPGRAEAGQGGGGPEVEVVRVGADGQDPAPAVVGRERGGGGERGGHERVSSVNVTSVVCSAPSRR